MGEHTKGTLTFVNSYQQPEIRTPDGQFIAAVGAYNLADARRLVACWNACDGTVTDMLEELIPLGGIGALADSITQMRVQRDELLEALQGLVTAVETPDADSLRELLAAHAAIAAATGSD